MPLTTIPDERDRLLPGLTPAGSDLGAEEDDALAAAEPRMMPDGSAMIPLDDEPEAAPSRHHDNLVERLETSELARTTTDVWDYVERD